MDDLVLGQLGLVIVLVAEVVDHFCRDPLVFDDPDLVGHEGGFQPAGQPLVPAKRDAGQQEKGQKEAVPEEVGNTAADIALFPEDRPVLFLGRPQ